MARKLFITGGAGFIGVNTAARALARGDTVVVYDNLSRRGGDANLDWLREQGEVTFVEGDIRDFERLRGAIADHADADAVIHLAGQVAVTTSIADPRDDYESNATGTLNVLESVRAAGTRPLVLYASTNKVYGGMEELAIVEDEDRYRYRDYPDGIPETMTLDFHSPYGCSKGAADQYVRDYSRIYGIPTVVFRQSCIYGPRQFGIEDQGWVAWFVIAAVLGRPITIFGDGKQVRDVLHVDDLVQAYWTAVDHKDDAAGRIFNVGGGPASTLSVWREFGPLLGRLRGEPLEPSVGDWRKGDQPIYVSDISLVRETLGWEPRITPAAGIEELYHWVEANQDMIARVLA